MGNNLKQCSEPEEGCGQEVHAGVCSQLEDAQQEVHKQFDSEPEKKKIPRSNSMKRKDIETR